MRRQRAALGLVGLVVLLGPGLAGAAVDDLGLRVAPGFRVTLYADQDLANDIFAMTLDSQGRVVVTGPGYVKVLHDTRGTGKADSASLFAVTPSGGMGMCFDGPDLYFCGDGWFSRYRDPDGKDRADAAPEHIAPLAFSEHGGHAMRKGPDGWWYIIGGNDSGIGRKHVTLPNPLVRDPVAGGLLRFTPDCRQSEVVAHGLRNPYDFDFNAAGDVFTYDSDVESDYFLPWYSPTRLYHIAPGGHHGWRLTGWKRSWCRPDYYLDTVDILWPVGRGSPTGVVCYRHDQFPEHYRGGVFAADWTFGKVYFFPLEGDGASYRTRPEVFLEPTGTHGFAPTDLCVAPDGSLFLCIGGRKTRGAVYHIEYVGDGKAPPRRASGPGPDLDGVLRAPQPLDAWSRARWVPLARKLGAAPFAAAVADETRPAADRVRAVEVLTELFGGLPTATARSGAAAAAPLVRARVAWSLGRAPAGEVAGVLAGLAEDAHPHVRCAALVALTERFPDVDAERLRRVLPSNLDHADKRVRQAAAHLAALLPDRSWTALRADLAKAPAQARLSGALAEIWRDPVAQDVQEPVIDTALDVLGRTQDAGLRLQCLRLVLLGLGDFHLNDPPVEAHTAYSTPRSLRGREALVRRILAAVRPLFPSGDATLDAEAARLLAVLEDDDPELPAKVAARWTADSSPTQDVHYLVVLSRLRGECTPDVSARAAQALLALHGKLKGDEQRSKQNWNLRLAEALANLLRHDPRLGDELLRRPALVDAAHVPLVLVLGGEQRRQAARLFLDAVRKDSEFAWSGPLIDLLARLPPEEVRPVLRGQWANFGLRDAILLQLAAPPEEVDREKFLTGLDSPEPRMVQACVSALERLPRDDSAPHLVPVLRLLRQVVLEPKEQSLRARIVALLARQTGQPLAVKEEGGDAAALKRVYQPILDDFLRQHPALAGALNGGDEEDPAVWGKLLEAVSWSKGDPGRGQVLFRNRACQTCHAGPRALGPDLTGVAGRFSRDDLFTAIIYPSRDVAPPYRTTMIQTEQGQVFIGLIAFESADGVIVQTGATTTVRVATADIANRLPSNRSLMPNGLLKDLKPEDLADLYAYLQTLKPKAPAGSGPR
jgi:putative membrane-bound dehydrogenase-like protein